MKLDKIINENKVLIFSGTGGVGKTTTSAAAALRSAELGYKTLILTIDPAQRLKTALGLKELNETVLVKSFDKGSLYASMIDYKSVFDEFVRTASPSPEAAQRVLKNPLYVKLSTELAGSQEYTSLERLFNAQTKEHYDRIFLDTPPSQHAIDFLKAPQKIYSLFDSSVIKWFLRGKEQKGFVEKFFARGTRFAMKQMEVLTGTDFVENLSDFFDSVQVLTASIQERSAAVQAMLSRKDTTFVQVTGFDLMKLKETAEFRKTLTRYGYRISLTIVNRAFPFQKSGASGAGHTKLREVYRELESYYVDRLESAMKLADDGFGEVMLVPDLPLELNDLVGLDVLKNRMINV